MQLPPHPAAATFSPQAGRWGADSATNAFFPFLRGEGGGSRMRGNHDTSVRDREHSETRTPEEDSDTFDYFERFKSRTNRYIDERKNNPA